MKKYFEILCRCPLFEGVNEEEMAVMLGCLDARVEHFDKKYTVFAEGAPARYLGIVLNGSVQTVRNDFYGNRSIIANAGPSEMFGEDFACAEMGAIPVSVIANEPSDIMLIDSAHVLYTCSNACSFHRRMVFNLMKDLARKAVNFHERIEITSKRTTREKLMAYLMLQAKLADSAEFEIPFGRQELADFLEVDRSGLSAEISKLRDEGVLESSRKHFKLL